MIDMKMINKIKSLKKVRAEMLSELYDEANLDNKKIHEVLQNLQSRSKIESFGVEDENYELYEKIGHYSERAWLYFVDSDKLPKNNHNQRGE